MQILRSGLFNFRLLLVAVAFCLLEAMVACGGSASSNSGNGGGQTTQQNPVPAIISLSPSSISAGQTSFTLTVTGQNFVSSASIQWNGSPLQTTYTSSSQLQAQIAATQISAAGTAQVSVNNPEPGGGNSGSAEFFIDAVGTPTPAVLSLVPNTVAEGTSALALTVNGNGFLPSSTVEWNSAPLPTSYLSGNQLEAQIPAANLTTSGFFAVTVVNSGPAGASDAFIFSVASAPMIVKQPATDLVWDSAHQLIYSSVPSISFSVPALASPNGNRVIAIDPATGSIENSAFAGSEPQVLAISGDNQYLYAGLLGSSSVQRFTLPGLVPDISYSLGASETYGPLFPWDLQVAPGLSHTTAVSRGIFSDSPWAPLGGMAIFDDGTQRPTVSTSGFYGSLQWASDTTIYAYNTQDTGFDLYALAVSPGGVELTNDYPNAFSGFYTSIHYNPSTNLLYGDDGNVVNPTNGKLVATFGASGLMIPDSTLNTAFFLGQTDFQSGSSQFTIASFDLTTYEPISETIISNVQGTPLRFVRWGTNGLAFCDNADFVYFISGPFVGPSAQTAAGSRKLYPVHKMKQVRLPMALHSAVRRRPMRQSHKALSASSVVPNPAPTITSLSPNEIASGAVAPGFTLTVNGSNFISLSTVEWNGGSLPTQFVSSTELLAQASVDVSTIGSSTVNVVTPGPGGGTSNNLPFTVIPTPGLNPAPAILAFYPSSVVAGGPGFTLDINGMNYSPSSVLLWNGSPRPVAFNDVGQLEVQVNSSDITNPGFATVTVVTPGPGGGSATAQFQIVYQPTVVNQVTTNMVWDQANQVIYVSIPSSASTHANQVCILNPATGKIGACQPGSEPDVIAISDDSQYLYVGMDGTGTVQRYLLPNLTPDISYSLADTSGNQYYALDLQVAPGAPHTTAVSKGTQTDPPSTGGITIFDDSTPRPITAPGWGPTTHSYDSIQWGADATALYSAESSSDGFDFYALTVNASGVVLDQDYPYVFWNPGRIHFDAQNGLVYSDDGFHAVNPSTGLPTGIFEVGGGWPMVPDSSLNKVFLLSQYVFQENANYTVFAFDIGRYSLISGFPFSTTQNGISQLGSLIRWGTNGLAVNDRQGNVYLISGPLVSASQGTGLRK
jgi:trimeric autotransporter adhesin